MDRAGNSILEVKQLTAGYGRVEILHAISLYVSLGELVAVLGPNGAGKTTLLRTISGMATVSQGEILFQEKNIEELPAHDRTRTGIVHVPEGRRVFKSMQVEENLLVAATRKNKKRLLAEIYKLFPRLYERRHQLAGSLSGGEQQMLAIGRGLMLQPTFLMLDEPSMGLSPIASDNIFAKLADIHQQLGIAVLLVEQRAPEALELANRVYVLEAGDIAVQGSPDELAQDNRIREAYMGI